MSRIGDIMKRLRAGDPSARADLARAQQAAARRHDGRGASPSSRRLRFTKHARRRMAQRGFTVRDVYAVWQWGKREALRERGMYSVTVTRAALEEAHADVRRALARHVGAAIVVRAGDHENEPRLITVIDDGESTRVR